MPISARPPVAVALSGALLAAGHCLAHGTVIEPASRVYRVYLSNPENPNFPLAENAVEMDGTDAYYTWNEVSRNIPEAVTAGLPPGFDYSPWLPDGAIASAGRTDADLFRRTYLGLDQVSADWPTTPVAAGETILVDFLATAPHDPSVWDVWMTTPDWDPTTPLHWAQLEYLGRPQVAFAENHYTFDLTVPSNRSGHHVLLVAWQRDDPVGEVFFSVSDLTIEPGASCPGDLTGDGTVDGADLGVLLGAWGSPNADLNDDGTTDGSDLGVLLGAWGECST